MAKKKTTKKSTKKKVTAKKRAQTVRTGESKADKARAIFKKMKNKPRADVIKAFMKIGLTKAGASTYYYNCKNEK